VCLGKCFKFCNEFFLHFRAFVDFFAGFFPVGGAVAVAGLFVDVFVDDFVDFCFVLVCDCDVGFLEDAVEPFPATHQNHQICFVPCEI